LLRIDGGTITYFKIIFRIFWTSCVRYHLRFLPENLTKSSMDVIQICQSLHRSAFSHFQRLQLAGSGEHEATRQTLAQSTFGVFCELSRLLRKQTILSKQLRRQRRLRFKRKLELDMLNQVASKLNILASVQAERRRNIGKNTSCLRMNRTQSNITFETEYLGDSSRVSSIRTNSLQIRSTS
jgi:hypothetical protein